LLVATAPNTLMLAFFLALLGLAIGLYHPAGISLIARAADARGAALGYHGLAGNIGIAVAPALAIGVAEATDSWRYAYVLLALIALVAAISLRLIRLPHDGVEPGAAAGTLEPAYEGTAAIDGRTPASGPAVRMLLPLLLVYAVFILNGFIYRGSLTFLPLHIEESTNISWFGIDPANLKAPLITAALLIGAFGQVLGGFLSERYPLARLAPLLTLGIAPFLLLMGVTSGLLLVVMSAGFVFFNFSSQPVYTGLIADYSPQQALGRSYGVSFFAAFGIGSLGATVAGFFADGWGTDAVFLALAGFAAVALALAIAIWWLAERPPTVRVGAQPSGEPWPARPSTRQE
jgi:MFS family permease